MPTVNSLNSISDKKYLRLCLVSDKVYCYDEIWGNFFLVYLEFCNNWHLGFKNKSNVVDLGTKKNEKKLKLH